MRYKVVCEYYQSGRLVEEEITCNGEITKDEAEYMVSDLSQRPDIRRAWFTEY